jgi:hypothetical protein
VLEVRNDFELTEDMENGTELAVEAAVETLGAPEACFSYRSGSLLIAGGLDNCIVQLGAGEGDLNRVCLRGLGQTVVDIVLLLCVSPPGNFEEQSTIDKIGRRAVNSGAFGVRKITSCWK